MAGLDPPLATCILSTAYLQAAYPAATPSTPPSYRELFKGLLLDLGGPIPTPGGRLPDFPEELDWTLPTRRLLLRTAVVGQPMARTSGLPKTHWLEDGSATFYLPAFLFSVKRKFADRNPVTGEVMEWKIVEVPDKFGPLTARIQKLTNRGCVRPWRGPFYIRDIALNHWLCLEFMKSSSLPPLEVHDPIPLQQLRFPPNPKPFQRKALTSPESNSPRSSSSKQGILEAWKRPAVVALTTPAGTVFGGLVERALPSTPEAINHMTTQPAGVEVRMKLGRTRVRTILLAPASPLTGQWFEDDERIYSLQEFTYLVGRQVSDVNRRLGATEVWVIKDVRVVHDLLVARRQRLTGNWLSGPWRG